VWGACPETARSRPIENTNSFGHLDALVFDAHANFSLNFFVNRKVFASEENLLIFHSEGSHVHSRKLGLDEGNTRNVLLFPITKTAH
jgi:hypothetical protein